MNSSVPERNENSGSNERNSSTRSSLLQGQFPENWGGYSELPTNENRHFNSIEQNAERAGSSEAATTLLDRIRFDHSYYYSKENFLKLGAGFVGGAVLANTNMDRNISRHFQMSVRNATSDDWFESLHAQKELGNGLYTIPVFATAWGIGKIFPESTLATTSGTWGERSLRAILVGAPPMLTAQYLTGGSRPHERSSHSHWSPFRDNNGVSGHSFMSSIPFITAAKMTERPWLKGLYYAASTLGPLSRINDDAHYPSQAILGWWMAYLAASVVDQTDSAANGPQIVPIPASHGSGIGIEFRR